MAYLNFEPLVLRLREICGATNVRHSENLAVAAPGTTAQAASALRATFESGLTGCAAWDREDPPGFPVVLDIRRMNRILQLEPTGSWVQVQTGITLLDLDQGLREEGFCLPLHFAGSLHEPLVRCIQDGTIGSSRHGQMRRLIALCAIWPDGTTFRTRSTPRQSVGPDLRGYFLQATDALITEATLQMVAANTPRRYETLEFSSPAAAFEAQRLFDPPPVGPVESVLEQNGSSWNLHLCFSGPKACIALGRDRATMGQGRSLGQTPAREFWNQRMPGEKKTYQKNLVDLLGPKPPFLEDGAFLSDFSDGFATLFTIREDPRLAIPLANTGFQVSTESGKQVDY